MDYLLDTNIIILYSDNRRPYRKVEEEFQLFNRRGPNQLFISVVSLGEVRAYIEKFGLGERRTRRIEDLLTHMTVVPITNDKIIQNYAHIDAYSQCKLPNTSFSARNMGKNDLWIAATAASFNLRLLTTDRDFDHLTDRIDLRYLDLKSYL